MSGLLLRGGESELILVSSFCQNVPLYTGNSICAVDSSHFIIFVMPGMMTVVHNMPLMSTDHKLFAHSHLDLLVVNVFLDYCYLKFETNKYSL